MKGLLSLLGGAALWAAAHLGGLTAVFHVSPTVQTAVGAAGAIAAVLGGRAAMMPANARTTVQVLGVLGAGWKTAFGATLAAITFLLSPEAGAVLPAAVIQVLTVISALLIALGVTHAGAANVFKTPPLPSMKLSGGV